MPGSGNRVSAPGSPAPADTSPQPLLELASAFQRSRALLTAVELGVFAVLGEDGHTSTQVAQALGTADRATDRLLNALCALGLLAKREGRFFNGPLAARYLVRGRPEYLAGLMHTAHLWETWGTLTEAVRLGRYVVSHLLEARGPDWIRAFIGAMHWRACQQAPGVVALLDLSRVARLLDVGGGSGGYAMAFARARPALRAVVFDLPHVIPLARDYIGQEGLGDRVETVPGDFSTDSLGGGFDLVFLSAILHGYAPGQNRQLLRKCAEALTPGGQLVVQDFIMEEDRTHPAFGALFALNMLVGTEGGDTYTEAEVREWVEAAGLGDIVRRDTAFGTTLIIGTNRDA